MKTCCTDHNGEPNRKYTKIEDAEKVVQQSREAGIGIDIYLCDDGDGWHLILTNPSLPLQSGKPLTREKHTQYVRRNRNRLDDLIDKGVVTHLYGVD